MSFSDLSRELRNIIYNELLYLPDGVHLQHVDWHRRMRMYRADVFSTIDRGDESHMEDEIGVLDDGMERSEVDGGG